MFSDTWTRDQANEVEALLSAVLSKNPDISNIQTHSSPKLGNYQVYFRYAVRPNQVFYLQYFIKEKVLRLWTRKDNPPVPAALVDFFDLGFKYGTYELRTIDGIEYHYLRGISEQYLRKIIIE